MSEQQADTMGVAMTRLEAALERLDRAVEARRAAGPVIEGDMVPKAAVAALATRLDATIAKLRANLGDAG
jgi:dihydroxyacetone kinase DhaKLM complex PTS-EIIA-like component DhaM